LFRVNFSNIFIFRWFLISSKAINNPGKIILIQKKSFFLDRIQLLIYDIFIIMNMSSIQSVSTIFQAISPVPRLEILLAIGEEEPCVCHLEATFGWRQAYLSQHLMALRKVGILLVNRHGRNKHYRLSNPKFLELIRHAAEVQGVSLPNLSPSPDCCCPNCSKQRGEGCK
jgi:DNA-binding transcriptional ArsR family regulator